MVWRRLRTELGTAGNGEKIQPEQIAQGSLNLGMPTEYVHALHSGSDDSLEIVGGGQRRVDLSTVGLMLRETRERYGLTLRDVGNALRIRVVYLHALEEGRFADLPGRPYVIGFLRSYAEYFGLDGDEVVRRYREERADVGRPSALVFPEPPPDSKVPVTAMLAILVAVSIVGYGVWHFVDSGSPADRPIVAEVPTGLALESDRLADAEDAMVGVEVGSVNDADFDGTVVASVPDSMASGTSAPTTTRSLAGGADGAVVSGANVDEPKAIVESAPVVEAAPVEDEGGAMIEFSSASAASVVYAEDVPAGLGGTSSANPDSLVSGQAPATTGPALSPSLLGFPGAGEAMVPSDLERYDPTLAAAPEGSVENAAVVAEATQVYGDLDLDARVMLRATADCWIQVNDAVGNEVFTRLLKAGEVYKVPNRDDLLLRMGNAGGLEIIVDGSVLPPLGGAGEVMRNVSLEPGSLSAAL